MPVTQEDIKLVKSEVVSDTDNNGGRMGTILVVSDVKNNVWPDIFQAERLNGVVKYRKLFVHNRATDGSAVVAPKIWLDNVTPAEGYAYIAAGTQTDTQADFILNPVKIFGCGTLSTDVTVGGTVLVVEIEDEQLMSDSLNSIFRVGDTIRVTDKEVVDATSGNEDLLPVAQVDYSGSGTSVTIRSKPSNSWQASTSYSVNDTIVPAGSDNGHWYVCTTEGTTDSSEPTWPTDGTSVSDGTVVWKDMGLHRALLNDYSATGGVTRVMSLLEPADIVATADNFVVTSSTGTYDSGNYPPELNNPGCVEQVWTVTITDGSTGAFDVTGDTLGSVGSGNISSDFEPINPDFSTAYFKLLAAGWGGTWNTGDTLVFETHPSAAPVWEVYTVPANTPSLTGEYIDLAVGGESSS